MKVTFIKHSCYFIELETCCLLFDYTEGAVPETDKPLYAFASHSHGDHFSPKLFELERGNRKMACFLSDDIWESRVPEALRDRTVFVSPHRSYEAEGLRVSTLRSTDAGVAFLIECQGKQIYHAGDLNCWVWAGAPAFQNSLMTEQYQKELELLSGKELDAAFVPLDPRQEESFDLGMKYFLEAANAKTVFPMHMWEDHSVIPRFKAAYPEYAGLVQDVLAPGQEFLLP